MVDLVAAVHYIGCGAVIGTHQNQLSALLKLEVNCILKRQC